MSGRYRLEGLPPGTYSLRVSAPDLAEGRYEGLDVRAGSTATLDVQLLGPGALSETVTVTARSPAIDTDTAERRIVLPGSVVKALPTARSYNALVVLVPGVVTNSNDIVTGHGDDVVSDPRRPDQRGPPLARRPDDWKPAERQLGDQRTSSTSATPRKSRSPPPAGSAKSRPPAS